MVPEVVVGNGLNLQPPCSTFPIFPIFPFLQKCKRRKVAKSDSEDESNSKTKSERRTTKRFLFAVRCKPLTGKELRSGEMGRLSRYGKVMPVKKSNTNRFAAMKNSFGSIFSLSDNSNKENIKPNAGGESITKTSDTIPKPMAKNVTPQKGTECIYFLVMFIAFL